MANRWSVPRKAHGNNTVKSNEVAIRVNVEAWLK